MTVLDLDLARQTILADHPEVMAGFSDWFGVPAQELKPLLLEEIGRELIRLAALGVIPETFRVAFPHWESC